METDAGRVPEGTGLSSSMEPASGLHPSGFDPSRVTDRDREVLRELIAAYDYRARLGWPAKLYSDGVWDGVAPIDCGGTDGSDHSYRLTKLCKLGLAEARKGASEWGSFSTRYKGSKAYRPTKQGRVFLRDSDEQPQAEDPKGLSGEAMPARAEGIAQPLSPQSSGAHK